MTTIAGWVHRASGRAWWAAGAALGAISLGMPWRASTLWPIYNVYNPWNCGVDWGGEEWASSRWCFQMLPTYSWYQGQATPGLQTPVRVFVAIAVVAVAFGLRLGRRRIAVAGAVIATLGGVLGGPGLGAGQVVYTAALIALWIGVRRTTWPPSDIRRVERVGPALR